MTQLFGKDNPAYRGGVTRLRTLIRNSKMYKQWKEIVYQKDRYKCQMCDYYGDRRTLIVHHKTNDFGDILQDFIAKYKDKYSLPKDEKRLLLLSDAYHPFWDVTNGITLCPTCHKQLHKDLKIQEKAKKEKSK